MTSSCHFLISGDGVNQSKGSKIPAGEGKPEGGTLCSYLPRPSLQEARWIDYRATKIDESVDTRNVRCSKPLVKVSIQNTEIFIYRYA